MNSTGTDVQAVAEPENEAQVAREPGAGLAAASSADVYAQQVGFHKGAHLNSEGVEVGSTGHGDAAEQMNHILDLLAGKDAEHLGPLNTANGADRRVGGEFIQTKYHASARQSIGACFAENGSFRYEGQLIEVPPEQYDDAVALMAEKIRAGRVPGHADPAAASEIVRKGAFTRAQAINVAKAGTVESLVFDATTGVVSAGAGASISVLITFALGVWSGKDLQESTRQAAAVGLQVFGFSMITHIAVQQLGRTGIEQTARAASDAIVRAMGPKVVRIICQSAGRHGLRGASARSVASKLLRSNGITTVVTVAVFSSVDFWLLAKGKISGGQAIKNVATTGAGVGGAAVGLKVGAVLGSVVPGVGTAIGATVGGIVGAVVGGAGAGLTANAALNLVIEDDAVGMAAIFRQAVEQLCAEFLIQEHETEKVVDLIGCMDLPELYRDMYASREPKRLGGLADQVLLMMNSPEDLALEGDPVFVARLQCAKMRLRYVLNMFVPGWRRAKVALPSEEALLVAAGSIVELVEDEAEPAGDTADQGAAETASPRT